jgi:membrane associated rhomboid family serine protease
MTSPLAVVVVIIGINVVVSVIAFKRFEAQDRVEDFLFIPHRVAAGENGQGMLLAHFAHGSWLHLAFNMFALYSFAGPVLASIGPMRFLVLYVLAGLGSDLVVFALRKDNPSYRCLGASGSVFGIVMAAVVLDPTTSIMLFFVPIPIPGPLFMLGYAVISVVLIARNQGGRVSHEGHLGGAIVGLALTGVLSPRGLGPLMHWFRQWL